MSGRRRRCCIGRRCRWRCSCCRLWFGLRSCARVGVSVFVVGFGVGGLRWALELTAHSGTAFMSWADACSINDAAKRYQLHCIVPPRCSCVRSLADILRTQLKVDGPAARARGTPYNRQSSGSRQDHVVVSNRARLLEFVWSWEF